VSFNIAVTGLNAATTDLGVVANNIANSNTTGFKGSRAEFGDLFSTEGFGTQLLTVTQQFQQGNLAATGNPLDLAVDGAGFFRLMDNGSTVYSRDGRFRLDDDGYIVNSSQQRLTGFQADANGTVTSALGDLQIPTANIDPSATTLAALGVNLDANATEPALAFDYQDPSTYNYTTTIEVFDGLGAAHSLDIFFRRVALPTPLPTPPVSEWTMEVSVDGGDPSLTTGASNTLTFDQAGRLDTTLLPQHPLSIDVPITTGAADPLTVSVDLSSITQFAGEFSTNFLTQDGYASGNLVGVSVGDSGVLFARYNNGQSSAIGQVALSNFRNPQGLTPIGDNLWVETAESGIPLIGAPDSGSLGGVQSGTLENSNIDLTAELINMINAQRNFQANAQVISTSDQLTQTLLNLR